MCIGNSDGVDPRLQEAEYEGAQAAAEAKKLSNSIGSFPML